MKNLNDTESNVADISQNFHARTPEQMLRMLVHLSAEIESIVVGINWKPDEDNLEGVTTSAWSYQKTKDILFAIEVLQADFRKKYLDE